MSVPFSCALIEGVRRTGLGIAGLLTIATAVLLFISPFIDDPRIAIIDGVSYWVVFCGLCVSVVLWRYSRWMLLFGIALISVLRVGLDALGGRWQADAMFLCSIVLIESLAGFVELKRVRERKSAL